MKPSLCVCTSRSRGLVRDCLRSFTKHGHIAETQLKFRLATTALIHIAGFAQGDIHSEYHHLHVTYTEKHICMSQNYTHHLIQHNFHPQNKEACAVHVNVCAVFIVEFASEPQPLVGIYLLSVVLVRHNEFMTINVKSPLFLFTRSNIYVLSLFLVSSTS